ncbi:MAG: ABC transporter ATP-binding protein [Niabella sp.]
MNTLQQITNTSVVVSISKLHKSFGQKKVLRGIDLQLHDGENLVVLGRSGTGKSVLIKIISGLLQQDSGSVMVLGKEIISLSKKELSRLRLDIGFSFQNGALYDSMTVYDNLDFPLKRNVKTLTVLQREERITETLRSVGMLHAVNQFPAELSEGQKKRVGIARTLILQPKIMLYDEPTAGLDPITAEEIIELINEVQQSYKTSSIIITHDLTCAKATGNRVMMMVDGKIIANGSFEEVFSSDNEIIKSFYDYNFVN